MRPCTLVQAYGAAKADGMGGHCHGQLSLGQQRRLSLARAFAFRPQLLVMDEPFASPDPAIARKTAELTARLSAAAGLRRQPAQNRGWYFQLSASGVTTSQS